MNLSSNLSVHSLILPIREGTSVTQLLMYVLPLYVSLFLVKKYYTYILTLYLTMMSGE